MRWVAKSVLLGSIFFAKELLKPSALLLDVGNFFDALHWQYDAIYGYYFVKKNS